MIPVSEPSLHDEELENIIDCVKTNWISSSGKYITEFEKEFAAFHKTKHAIALSNGTAALEVALYASGIRKGDEVIVPSFTIISVALAVLRIGAIPRFVDVDCDTWNIDPDLVEDLINEKTRAIIGVHSFGHPFNAERILKIVSKHKLILIEDTAESMASKYKGSLCGTFGDVATFSLYANKLITTGEGGIIITNSDEIANKARRYINLYFGHNERFSHDQLGFNFRMTNMQAAIGLAQMKRVEKHIERKKTIGAWYKEEIKGSKYFQFQQSVGEIDHVYWMYSFLMNDEVNLESGEMISLLKDKGIESRQLFKGLHLQRPLKKYLFEGQCNFIQTEKLYRKGFYLPSSINLTRNDVKNIVCAINEIAECHKKK
tara:strand:+ start:6812 stop:7933 length:1122 start_codon:yes stop_codon:yes gene_type:complete